MIIKNFLRKRKEEFELSFVAWIVFGLIGSIFLLYFVGVYPQVTIVVYTLLMFVLYTKFLHDADIEQEEERADYERQIKELKDQLK